MPSLVEEITTGAARESATFANISRTEHRKTGVDAEGTITFPAEIIDKRGLRSGMSSRL